MSETKKTIKPADPKATTTPAPTQEQDDDKNTDRKANSARFFGRKTNSGHIY